MGDVVVMPARLLRDRSPVANRSPVSEKALRKLNENVSMAVFLLGEMASKLEQMQCLTPVVGASDDLTQQGRDILGRISEARRKLAAIPGLNPQFRSK